MDNQMLNIAISKACERIAPAWPLKNFVAVNPYLGLTDVSFSSAAKILSERSGINMTMSIPFYVEQVENGQITEADINIALINTYGNHAYPNEFIKKAKSLVRDSDSDDSFSVSTVIDIAEEISGIAWNAFMVDKISSWAASYYDEYQASWNTTDGDKDLYTAWKSDAIVDLSPQLMGLKGFRTMISQMPENTTDAIVFALQKLNVSEDIVETYLHSLLLRLNGWSSFIVGNDWNNAMYGGGPKNLKSFLSILLTWELCLFDHFKSQNIAQRWNYHQLKIQSHELLGYVDQHLEVKLIMQDAYDLACQRQLKDQFESHQVNIGSSERVKAQAVFCIDVRSEVYRRCLESVDAEIETLGFAGFFGFPINYVPLAHKEGKNHCPVLMPSGPIVKETFGDQSKFEGAKKRRIVKHQVEKTWKKFKSGAISSFGFVSPVGLSYLPKLISDSFGWTRPITDPDEDGLGKWLKQGRELDLSAISLEDKISMAATALAGMGLKETMAPLILITGHCATSVNNPHATGLDCGACGGHSGEINSMTAERIFNDPLVRRGLSEKGIDIPFDTHFIACLHNTTTDEVHIIGAHHVPSRHKKALLDIEKSLISASQKAREERALRFDITTPDVNASMLQRSKDWSQVRPEWGLAGCSAFIVAPRKRTIGMNLGGKSFLHSYHWQSDEDFMILESILTAPMIVTSWINLQYYASTTDNAHYGAGNKTLHNVTGGIGVLEGSGGDLRIGLPLQSLHDGKKYQHLPQRLNVIIEAPMKAINEILAKNPSIKDLCDNAWITLLQLDDNGKINNRYTRNFIWEDSHTAVYDNKEKWQPV